MRCRLLVPDQDMANAGFVQLVIYGQDNAAWITENGIHALGFEGLY